MLKSRLEDLSKKIRLWSEYFTGQFDFAHALNSELSKMLFDLKNQLELEVAAQWAADEDGNRNAVEEIQDEIQETSAQIRLLEMIIGNVPSAWNS